MRSKDVAAPSMFFYLLPEEAGEFRKLGDRELNAILEVAGSVAQWMSILGAYLTTSL